MASRSVRVDCWKCANVMKDVLLPFSRYEECSQCKADLHVCYACRHYDPAAADACREDRAEFVLDKDRANFCDYFLPGKNAFRRKNQGDSRAAEQQLAELFGEELPQTKPGESASSESDQALAELKRLFGDED